jgi:23S rRNA pseudouridine2605 synthase
VFDNLPPELPRVMSVGRLDLNSEGLLLLTNDGALKRRLELPSTGWLRKYRVRIKGNPADPDLEPLRRGITVEGERFQPMTVTLDRLQGANAWLTVGLREGKNREIRRALSAINLTVNRLIRVSYGPFRLNDMEPGQVEEVKAKTLREQLGEDPAEKPVGTAVKKTRAPRPGTPSNTPRASQGTPVPRSPAKPGAPKAAPKPAARKTTPALQQLSNAWTKATTPEKPAAKPKSARPAAKDPATPRKPKTRG